jgi:hypothetical protein
MTIVYLHKKGEVSLACLSTKWSVVLRYWGNLQRFEAAKQKKDAKRKKSASRVIFIDSDSDGGDAFVEDPPKGVPASKIIDVIDICNSSDHTSDDDVTVDILIKRRRIQLDAANPRHNIVSPSSSDEYAAK